MLHWTFKEKVNKADSNNLRDFNTAEIDTFLNEAQNIIVNLMYSHYEENQYVKDVLAPLVTSTETNSITSINNYYSIDFETDYIHMLRVEALENGCNSYTGVTATTLDNLNNSLVTAFQKPSTRWKRILGVQRNNTYCLYSENTITSVRYDYLKKPDQMCLGGYDDINGNPLTQQNCVLPDFIQPQLVDISVMIAQGIIENNEGLQIVINKLNLTNNGKS